MWTLKYNGEAKALADWGISNLVRNSLSFGISTVTFDVSAAFDAEDVFAYGGSVEIFRDNVQWFVGRVDRTPRIANPRYEGHGYVLADPWWYLVELTYQIAWKELANPLDPDQGLTEKFYSDILLNIRPDGTLVTIKDQIRAVLDYAIEEAEAPLQIGSIELPELYPPTSQVSARRCSEVIEIQRRFAPDAVSYFDHSTSPPTLHIKQRSALVRVTIPATTCTDIQIQARNDLQVPAVIIQYRRTNVVNGVPYYVQDLDVAPPGATGTEFKALVAPVDLQGTTVNASFATIVCDPISESDIDWWKAQHPPLNEETIRGLTIAEGTREGDLPNELVSGTIPGWLLQKQEASAQRIKVRALATYDQMDEDDETTVRKKVVNQPVHTEITATDLESGSYLNSLSVSFGQPTPVGLANYLYQATNRLHFDGGFALSEEECSSLVGTGNVVCLSGGKAEWAEMDAVVQSVSESIDNGRTTVVIGPPKHLGVDDIIELLGAIRNRVQWTPISVMTTGSPASISGGSAPKEAPVKNSNADGGKVERLMLGSLVAMDVENIPSAQAAGRPPEMPLNVKFRVIPYCEDGVQKKICVLASEVFDGDAPLEVR